MWTIFSRVTPKGPLTARLWRGFADRRPSRGPLAAGAVQIAENLEDVDKKITEKTQELDSDFLLKLRSHLVAAHPAKAEALKEAAGTLPTHADLQRLLISRCNGKTTEDLVMVMHLFEKQKFSDGNGSIYVVALQRLVAEKCFDDLSATLKFLQIYRKAARANFFCDSKNVDPKKKLSLRKEQYGYLETLFVDLVNSVVRHKSYLTEAHLDTIWLLLEELDPANTFKTSDKLRPENALELFKVELFDRLAHGEGPVVRDLKILERLVYLHRSPQDSQAAAAVRGILTRSGNLEIGLRSTHKLIFNIFKNTGVADPEVLEALGAKVLSCSRPQVTDIVELIIVHVFCRVEDSEMLNKLLISFTQRQAKVLNLKWTTSKKLRQLHLAMEFLKGRPDKAHLWNGSAVRKMYRLTKFCLKGELGHVYKFSKKEQARGERNHYLPLATRETRLLQVRELRQRLFQKPSILEDVAGHLEEALADNRPLRVRTRVRVCQFEVPFCVYYEAFGVDVMVLLPPSTEKIEDPCRQRAVKVDILSRMEALVIEVPESRDFRRALAQKNSHEMARLIGECVSQDVRLNDLLEERQNIAIRNSFLTS